jgi:hypothetical protein
VGRGLLRSALALVLVAASALIVWRVLAPAEVHATAGTRVPTAEGLPQWVTGRLLQAPLIVDGRVRVYASKRQVRADAPVGAKMTRTARWSLRRWPQQVSGVVAAGRTVITRWSDGELVAAGAWGGPPPPRGPVSTGTGPVPRPSGRRSACTPREDRCWSRPGRA